MSSSTLILSRGAVAAPRSRGFRVCLWLHRWTGLLATPFFLVLCLTGSVLIFHEEVDEALGDRPVTSREAAVPPLGPNQLVAAAQAAVPNAKPMMLFLDPEKPNEAFVSLGPPDAVRLDQGVPVLLDRATAAAQPFRDPDATVTGFILRLHSQWLSGIPGQLFGGGVALLVLTALVTGIVVHAPFVRRVAFGTVRRGRGTRIVQLDLHNLVGLVVLGWATLVTVTGIMLAAGAILIPVWEATGLRRMAGDDVTPPAIQVTAEDAAIAATRAMPDRRLEFILFPGTELSSPRHFMVGMYGTQQYNQRLFDVVLVDAGTGNVAAAGPLPWWLQTVVLSEPLHFGNYGGLPLKLLWVGSVWATLFITGNGAWLWLAKRRIAGAAR